MAEHDGYVPTGHHKDIDEALPRTSTGKKLAKKHEIEELKEGVSF